MKKPFTRLTALALSLALLLTSCSGGASATSMHLRKTEGTVGVSDGEGKELTPKGNLGLYSGYQVGTQAESYAWIDLDRVKLTKLDADSQIEINKEGKKLEIDVKSGSLFFNVTEPLDDDETLDVVTSTMIIGIRGTCGWVGENTAALLEGTVSVTTGEQEVTISAGEMAVLMEDGLEVKPLTAASIPAFVRDEIAEDEDLAADIQETIGMDLTGADPLAPYADIINDLIQHNNEILLAELIDFEADDSPELLLIRTPGETQNNDYIIVNVSIWRYEPDEVKQLNFQAEYYYSYNTDNKISLAELDGRKYIHFSKIVPSTINTYQEDRYIGSISEKDGDSDDWGCVDWRSSGVGAQNSISYRISYQKEDDPFYGGGYECSREEFEAWMGKYTDIRDLIIYDGDNLTVVKP